MGQNIYQVYQGNPITTNEADDLMYFGRSPYSATDDAAMTFQNFAAQFLTPTTGVVSITGTQYQVLANGTYGSAVTGGNVTLTLPQDIATTSSPTFAGLTLSSPLTVANGGTGKSSLTAYTLIAGGTTTTGVLQQVSAGSAGQLLQSNGASALPTWTTATFPSGSGTLNHMLRSDGTNWVETTNTTLTSADVLSGLTQLNVDNLRLDGNTISAVNAGGNITLVADGTGNVDVFTPPASEASGINVNGFVFNTAFRVNDIGTVSPAQSIIHRHSTTLEPVLLFARANSDTDSHAAVTNGMALSSTYSSGWTGAQYSLFGQIRISADSSGTISDASAPGKLDLMVSPNGSITPVTALSINNAGVVSVTNTLDVGNLQLSGNTLSSTNTNGNIISSANGSGKYLFGTGTSFTSTVMQGALNGNLFQMALGAYTNDGNQSSYNIYKSRSTSIGSFTTVQNTDLVGSLSFYADDGTQFLEVADIICAVQGATSTGIVPTSIRFNTTNTSGVRATQMRLNADGTLFLNNPLQVAYGGTGVASTTAYALIAGGTTSTGNLQSLSTGTSGQLLQSNGAGALPSWTTATFPSGSGTLSHMLRSDGTNWVQTTSMTVDASDNLAGLTSVSVGNLQLTGNTLSSTNTNGNVIVSPNGNGILNSVSSIQITSPTSPAVKYIGLTAATDSRLIMQAGTITSSDGGALNLYGATHATRAGWVVAGLSTAGAFFAVNDSALAGGTNQFTVARADGSVVSNGSITASSNIISNAGYVQSGLSSGGFAGNVILYPSTASKGSLSLLAADSGANYANILTNASTSAARTWTLPDASGTIALTSGASGIVNSGTQNQLAWYAANGTTVSGLSTANNGLLVTNGSGVPSIGNAIGADITVNGLTVGKGTAAISTNSALGVSALAAVTTATGSTALGYQALLALQSGNNNTAIGSGALKANISSTNNTAIGQNSLAATTGAGNTGVGVNALLGNVGGSNNTAMGQSALYQVTAQDYNTAFGYLSGQTVTSGGSNTFLGALADGSTSAAAGVIAIGRAATADTATGSTSGTNGPSIAIGSSTYPVGFRGDASIYPSAGTSAGYWRVKINGTFYKILLCADS